jgi:hypothetical protein
MTTKIQKPKYIFIILTERNIKEEHEIDVNKIIILTSTYTDTCVHFGPYNMRFYPILN